LSAIRHIVFDLGRVLLRWEPELPFLRLIPDAIEREHFLTEVCNARWLLDTDLGTSWEEAERALIARHPEQKAMIRAFRQHWHEMVPGLVEGTPLILSQLIASGHDVTALTNFATDTFDEALDRFGLLGAFRGITVSARVGLAKPDEAIFERHAADFGLDPGATLFFDDAPANVHAAQRVGWQAEIFRDADTMRRDLKRHGVKID
jgi:HAD superfamily hydrolase (TIGR01509 family)